MSSAFGDPPDSGVNVSPSAEGAATRRASRAAASAASIRRRGMPVGKARGSYLRPARTLHFVRVAPSGLSRAPLRLDLELSHPQAPDLEFLDAQLLDPSTADRETADRDRAERNRADGQRADCLGADYPGADGAGADGHGGMARHLTLPGRPAPSSPGTPARPPGSRACARGRAAAPLRARAGPRDPDKAFG